MKTKQKLQNHLLLRHSNSILINHWVGIVVLIYHTLFHKWDISIHIISIYTLMCDTCVYLFIYKGGVKCKHGDVVCRMICDPPWLNVPSLHIGCYPYDYLYSTVESSRCVSLSVSPRLLLSLLNTY